MSPYLKVIRKLILVSPQDNNQRKENSYFVAASISTEVIKLTHINSSCLVRALRLTCNATVKESISNLY